MWITPFYKIFDGDSLCPDVSNTVGNADYQHELERLYVYYRDERHNRLQVCSVVEAVDAAIKKVSQRYFAENEELVSKSVLPNALKYLVKSGMV